GFGIPGARIVASGDPCRSVLYFRFSKLGNGHMPYLGSSTIDVSAARLLYDWIRQLPTTPIADEGEQESVTKSRAEETAWIDTLRSRSASDNAARLAALDRLLGSVRGAMALLRLINDGALDPDLKSSALAKGIGCSDPMVRDLFQQF